jgi:hypothetical protein
VSSEIEQWATISQLRISPTSSSKSMNAQPRARPSAVSSILIALMAPNWKKVESVVNRIASKIRGPWNAHLLKQFAQIVLLYKTRQAIDFDFALIRVGVGPSLFALWIRDQDAEFHAWLELVAM